MLSKGILKKSTKKRNSRRGSKDRSFKGKSRRGSKVSQLLVQERNEVDRLSPINEHLKNEDAIPSEYVNDVSHIPDKSAPKESNKNIPDVKETKGVKEKEVRLAKEEYEDEIFSMKVIPKVDSPFQESRKDLKRSSVHLNLYKSQMEMAYSALNSNKTPNISSSPVENTVK